MNVRKWLAAVVLMAVPVCAWAQTVQQDGSRLDPGRRGSGQATLVGGMIRADTTMGILTTVSGNLMVTESAPIFNQNGVAENIINNSGLAAAAGDSNQTPIDTHKWRVTGLFIKAVPAGGVGTHSRLAFQIRAHLNNQTDSSSTFVWYPIQVEPRGGDADGVYPDSLNVGHITTGSTTAAWSGEFIVTAARNRNAPASGVTAPGFHYPSGIYIPLSNWFGTDYWAPYTSVRVRNITGPTCAVTVHLIGTPL